MKRAFTSIVAGALTLALGSGAVAATSQTHAAPKHKTAQKTKLSKWEMYVQQELRNSAPGDEYFGRMKMSYLGINNTFHDDSIRAGAYTTDPGVISSVGWANEALNAWRAKYPHDPQLARSYFLAFEMYRKIWTQAGQQQAWQYAQLLDRDFPTSYFGKLMKQDLARGFTEHWFAQAQPCPATPAPSPSPGGKHPSPSPSPSATPEPSPSPTATPTRAPGQPPVDILPVPCITPPPTPQPVMPSPTPTPK